MKKWLVAISVVLMLVVGCGHTTKPILEPLTTEDQICSNAEERARNDEVRGIVDMEEGIFVGVVIHEGECVDGTCILKEDINGCGWIRQYLDTDGNGEAEVVVIFGVVLNNITDEFIGWSIMEMKQISSHDEIL